MAYNGSGTFNRLYDWTDDRDANIKIRADRMDAEMDGFATGLSTAITKDGQTTVTANLPMAGFKHTGVGDAAARNQYMAAGQLQDGEINWVDGGGTADAITATYSPAVTALVDGMLLFVRATAANATTTPTFAPNGLTARTIVKDGGSALVAGDIVGDGHELILRYDLSNTRWELLNPKTDISGLQSDVITTRGDVIRGDLSGNAERLAIGSTGTVLASDGTDAAWTDPNTLVSSPSQATQSAIEAETDENTYVPPDLIKHSPGVAKAWGNITYSAGTPTLNTDYNIASISDGGVGLIGVTIETDFSSGSFAPALVTEDSIRRFTSVTNLAAGSFSIQVLDNAGSGVDPVGVHFACFGDQ